MKNRKYRPKRGRVRAVAAAFLVALGLLHMGCGGNEDFRSAKLDRNKDGKPDQFLYVLNKANLAVLLETDEDQDGVPDDFTWVRGEPARAERTFPLYEEKRTKAGVPFRRTWFGPVGLRIVGREDLDGDGYAESTVYYNSHAVPNAPNNVVARFAVDSGKKGKNDIWFFPGARIEADTNGDGRPDRVQTNPTEIARIFDLLHKGKLKPPDVKGGGLSPSASWVLHPDTITRAQNRATIPMDLPVADVDISAAK